MKQKEQTLKSEGGWLYRGKEEYYFLLSVPPLVNTTIFLTIYKDRFGRVREELNHINTTSVAEDMIRLFSREGKVLRKSKSLHFKMEYDILSEEGK